MTSTRNSLLMSVAAAALTAGIGVAFAQAPSPPAPSPAPAAQQSAPAEKIAPALEPSKGAAPDAGKQSGKADEKKGDKAAQDNNKDGMKPTATSSETKAPASEPKAATSETKAPGKTSSDMKADTKTKADVKPDAKSSEKPGDAKAGVKPETKAGTTGQGAAGTSASLSTEQRTTIRSAVQKQGAQRTTNVNFSISVGTQVPRSVRFHRVPSQLVVIYPDWRGYDYFLVGDQIIVVNPRTHQIVAVLDA